MERLTAKSNDGHYYYLKCFEECDGEPEEQKCRRCDLEEMACDKLGRYEDQEELEIVAIMADETTVSIAVWKKQRNG